MRWFRRGAHRNGPITVAELQAQIAVEVIPTGQKVGGAQVVWKNGQLFYQWATTFCIASDLDPDSAVILQTAPGSVINLSALVTS